MKRRIPYSGKKRRLVLKEKRAVKRGDISPPPAPTKQEKNRRRHRAASVLSQTAINAAETARRLQSSFVKLPRKFLDHTKLLAATIPLQRPIPSEVLLSPSIFSQDGENDGNAAYHVANAQLTCPTRPKWRYDMSKKELENNEEVLFKKWIEATDQIIDGWFQADLDSHDADDRSPPIGASQESSPRMPSAPASYERNLEVWRQLWRVTEIAQIILILLDSRCPLLHYPPSLQAYLSSPHIAKHIRPILVLTKVDIAGPARAEAWTRYLNQKFPGLRVVQVEAFAEKHTHLQEQTQAHGDLSGSRKHYEPHLPSTFRQSLVEALKETHAELLQPPKELQDNPERLKSWTPPVKKEVNWQEVLNAHGEQVGTAVGDHTAPHPSNTEGVSSEERDERDAEGPDDRNEINVEPEYLTVGLIGQPNVGKSSLLNALFGFQKVKASKTPGKTKHFQTLFWTSEVRLVDCPGLVMPNLSPMETQVLSGILPISRVSAIPLCIHHVAQLLPLERIYGLEHPSVSSPPVEDKRTWRGPRPASSQTAKEKEPTWNVLELLSVHATKKGYITARSGWPDTNRSGNAILRAVAEGKIRWAFWPPGTPLSVIEQHQSHPGDGIWISSQGSTGGVNEWDVDGDSDDEDKHDRVGETDEESLADEDEDEEIHLASDDEEWTDEGDDHHQVDSNAKADAGTETHSGSKQGVAYTGGRFGALSLEAGADPDSED